MPIYYSAKISGKNDAKILPQINGTIVAKCVEQGDIVTRGQALFKIDSIPFLLSVQQAKANVATATANLSIAKLNYESTQTLYQKGVVSAYVLETTQNEYASAQAAVKVAEAQLALAYNDLNHCTIVSPVNGVVGTINYSVGDLVSPSLQEPLTVVSDNHIAEAAFALNETQYIELLSYRDELFNGQYSQALQALPDVELKLKSGKMYPHKGRIISLSGVVDATTGSVICKADFPNEERTLTSGISGTVVIPSKYDSVMVIPNTAVNQLQDKLLAYVVQPDSTVRTTIIEAESLNDGKSMLVLSGLNEGDQIVTIGVNNLVDGEKVIF